jgi:hypothetical protein
LVHGWHGVVDLGCLMLSLSSVALVIVVVAVSVLVRAVLMTLLGACPEVLRSGTPIASSHIRY